jgi:hypothetical protein
MKTITKNFLDAADLIKVNPGGDGVTTMPVFMVIDWCREIVFVELRSLPLENRQREVSGLDWAFELPGPVNALEIRNFIKNRIIPITEKIKNNYDIRWDGTKVVADWGIFAEEAAELHDWILWNKPLSLRI